MLQLCWVGSNKPPIWLVGEKYSIGSGSECDFVVKADGIAVHAVDLVIDDDNLILMKRDRQQDCRVNNSTVLAEAPLQHGDKIQLGDVVLDIIDPKLVHNSDTVLNTGGSAEWALQSLTTALSNRKYTIEGESILGRSQDCDICLAVSHLSRKHARLSVSGGSLFVEDLNSSNGTFVNGRKISAKVALNAGDELSFDTLRFRITNGDDDDVDKTSLRPAIQDTELPRRPMTNTGSQKPLRSRPKPISPSNSLSQENTLEETLDKAITKESGNTGQWVVLAVVVLAIAGLGWFLIV